MVILVTNDDGDSQGLRILFEAAAKFDKRYAIIPNRQRSAIGCALTLHKPLRLAKIQEDMYSINGTPSDCALFSMYSDEFTKPSLILSGLNWGDNTGMGPLIGSGTIGACWQGAINGTPAIAFSVEVRSGDWRDKENWVDEKIAISTIEKVIKLLKPKLKPFHFFNVNLPINLTEKSEIIFNQKIQRKRYNTRVEKRIDPESRPYYWTMGEKIKSDGEGKTDFEELLDGKIVITEISLNMFAKKD